MKLLDEIKKVLINKYNIKELDKIKIIIRLQVIRDMIVSTININQLTFIKNLIIKKRLTNFSTNVILIKTRLTIKILDLEKYHETNL